MSPASSDAANPRVRGVSRSPATRKRPFAISRADRAILSVAGLWERWVNPAGGEVETFTVITTDRNNAPELLAPVGDAPA
jgi:putative SOS response-associated peptidase YedK